MAKTDICSTSDSRRLALAGRNVRMAATVGPAQLSNSAVNLAALREYSRTELIDVLDSVPGPKILVIDPQLTGPLGLVAELALLKDHLVEQVFHLKESAEDEARIFDLDCRNIIYMCRPKMHLMKIIANQVRNHQKWNFSLFFVPRMTLVCRRILEKEGVIGDIKLGDYSLDIIPFDDDVICVGTETFRESFLEGDNSSLFVIARAIMKLQTMFGYIPNIKMVADVLRRLKEEATGDGVTASPVAPEIENLVIIDRDVDLVTPMLTQLTYEGLIDEFFKIKNTYVELDPEVLGREPPKDPKTPPKPSKYPLNSNDRLYAEFRDTNFAVLGSVLHKKAHYIAENFEERPNASAPVSQLRDFMKKLPELQIQQRSLQIHTNIADKIGQVTSKEAFHRRLEVEQGLLRGLALDSDFVEECINKQEPLEKVLRLLCLASLTSNGLKTKQYDLFRREILHTYGYDKLLTLHNLEKAGMMRQNDGRANWASIRKQFRLVDDEVDEENPRDISYVYSGFAPLSCRLVQSAIRPGGWRGMEEQMRMLPGPTVETTQKTTDPSTGADVNPARKGVTLVFFIGGCTFTEISAIRFIGQHEEGGQRDFLIGTTKIISGDSLVSSLSQNLESNLQL